MAGKSSQSGNRGVDVLPTRQAPLGCTVLPEYSEYSLPLSEVAGWLVTVAFLRTEQVLRVRSHRTSLPPIPILTTFQGNGGDCYPRFLFQINTWIQRGKVIFPGSHSKSMTYLAGFFFFFSSLEMVDW